jgi:predicted dehydrogenase
VNNSTETVPPVRVGFVGVGQMGQCAHLRNYATLPGCRVVAIAEVRPELGRRVAARYGVPNVYRDDREMLERESLQGLVVSQPFDRHGALLPPILQAGIPIFTEKPLAASVGQGERILAALRGSGTWHMVGYHKRSDPATRAARAEIDRLKTSGELGKMRYVRITMPEGDWAQGGFTDLITTGEPVPPADADPPDDDMDRETQARFTSFVNYYIHQVNLMRHLLGEPYRVTYAEPSGVLMAVRSDSGVAGVIEMTPYRTTRDWQESALVGFEKGYVRLDLPAPMALNRAGRVEFFRDPGEGSEPQTIVPSLPAVHAMRRQAENFIAAIRGEARPPCEADEALEDLKVAREYIRLLSGK